MERFGFDEDYWHQSIARFFAAFQTDYARRRGKRRWADKTPSYVFLLPFIDRLFPRCQVVHVIRDGLDVVASHRDRWGWRSALASCDTWRKSIEAARTFGAKAETGRYLEVRYENLVRESEKTLRDLLDALGEPWDEAVLEYDRVDHDQGERHANLTESRRQEGGETALVYESRVGVGRRKLGPLLKLMFRRRAGALQRELGYDWSS
jgi:hypothetical protein